MSALEGIVRPFQRPNSLATRRLIASNRKVEVTPARMTWGATGTLPQPVQVEQIDPTGLNFNVVNAKETFTETSRKNDRITITDPAGSGSSLQVDRPYQMTYSKKTQPPPNVMQTWTTAYPTPGYVPVNPNSNDTSTSNFNLNRQLT